MLGFWDWFRYVLGLASDLFLIVYNMSMGFFDQGKSFNKAFIMLDNDYHQREWLSDETLDMIQDERDTYMVNWDFKSATGPTIFLDWWKGRMANLKNI